MHNPSVLKKKTTMSTSDFSIDPSLKLGSVLSATNASIPSQTNIDLGPNKFLKAIVLASEACKRLAGNCPMDTMNEVSAQGHTQNEFLRVLGNKLNKLVKRQNNTNKLVGELTAFFKAIRQLFKTSNFGPVLNSILAKERESWTADVLERVKRTMEEHIKQAMDARSGWHD